MSPEKKGCDGSGKDGDWEILAMVHPGTRQGTSGDVPSHQERGAESKNVLSALLRFQHIVFKLSSVLANLQKINSFHRG